MAKGTGAAERVADAASTNIGFYDALWSQCRLARPERFNTWPLIAGLLPGSPERLEVGPGLRPRLPLAGTHFVDISTPVIERLNARGALAQSGEVSALPFASEKFDLVCAFDILEHIGDDRRALSELSRVLKKEGVLIVSVPLHESYWTEFDDLVGHVRRYHPADLPKILAHSGLLLEKSAPFGMQPNNQTLLRFGIWLLKHRRGAALFWYNRVFLPLGIFFQPRLQLSDGPPDCGVDRVAEIVMICRKASF